jgi:hypothetical protein
VQVVLAVELGDELLRPLRVALEVKTHVCATIRG